MSSNLPPLETMDMNSETFPIDMLNRYHILPLNMYIMITIIISYHF